MANKFCIVFLFVALTSYSQTLQRQSLGSQGKAVMLSSGFFVSQSIGQQSMVGSGRIGDKNILQGFQQSSKAIRFITEGLPDSGNVRAFPNPFSDVLNFEFTTTVSGPVTLSVFDGAGRLVLVKEVEASENATSAELANLQSGIYHLTLDANQQTFYTTVIRK